MSIEPRSDPMRLADKRSRTATYQSKPNASADCFDDHDVSFIACSVRRVANFEISKCRGKLLVRPVLLECGREDLLLAGRCKSTDGRIAIEVGRERIAFCARSDHRVHF